MESKCGLLQGGCCPSHLSADLCLGAMQLRFRGKVDSTSIFHGKPWKCQRGNQKPQGRNVPEVEGGKEDSESKETSTSSVCWGGGGLAVQVDVIVTAKQTSERTGLKKHPWSTQSINCACDVTCDHHETSGLSSHERNRISRRKELLKLAHLILSVSLLTAVKSDRINYTKVLN